jgi:hypothetical protein
MEYLMRYVAESDSLHIFEKTRSTGEREKLDEWRHDIVLDACQKFNEVLYYVRKKTLPKRPYEIDHWRCSYCGWGKTCWKNYEAEFAELKTKTQLPDEIADTIRYYRELGGQKKDIEKEYKDLSTEVKKVMKAANSREGIAGEYIAKLSLVESKRLDKSLLTTAEIEKATKKSFYEKLSISKRKEI